ARGRFRRVPLPCRSPPAFRTTVAADAHNSHRRSRRSICSARLRCELAVAAHQLGAGGDAQLLEDLAQVVVDRARAQEQLGGDLPVRCALADEAGDLELLGRELVDGGGIAPARGLAACPELATCSLLPRSGSHALEGLEGGSELDARLPPAPRAPK